MNELLNPLQIAGRLKKTPTEVVRAIKANGIKPQVVALRGGLFDLSEVQSALEKPQEQK